MFGGEVGSLEVLDSHGADDVPGDNLLEKEDLDAGMELGRMRCE